MVGLIVGIAAFAGGFYAARRWAPPLAPTRVGDLAALVVAVLVGAALGVVGLDVYSWIDITGEPEFDLLDNVEQILRGVFFSAGSLLGLAAVVHLLAPAPDDQ